MAALQERNESFRVIFRYHGKQHSFTLGRVSRQEAEAKAGQVDLILLRIEQNLLVVTAGQDHIAPVLPEHRLDIVGGRAEAPYNRSLTVTASETNPVD